MKEDLGIKIGTPKEAIWNQVKKNAETGIINHEIEIEIFKNNIKLAEEGIKSEQTK